MSMLENELTRVIDGNTSPYAGTLAMVAFELDCPAGAAVCIGRCREVLRCHDGAAVERGGHVVAADLPGWFVESCSPERSVAEAKAYLAWWDSLDAAEKAEVAVRSQTWSVRNWLHAMDEDRREWWWWRGIALDERTARVECEVQGLPISDGALRWLLRVAGAGRISDVMGDAAT